MLDWALIGLVIASISLICNLVLLLTLKRVSKAFPEVAGTLMQQAINDIAPQFQEVITEGFNSIGLSLKGMVGGIGSGVSRQMKGLEKELMADGIDQMTGLSGAGALAAKYIDKYPIIKSLLPLLAQRQTQSNLKKTQSATTFGGFE